MVRIWEQRNIQDNPPTWNPQSSSIAFLFLLLLPAAVYSFSSPLAVARLSLRARLLRWYNRSRSFFCWAADCNSCCRVAGGSMTVWRPGAEYLPGVSAWSSESSACNSNDCTGIGVIWIFRNRNVNWDTPSHMLNYCLRTSGLHHWFPPSVCLHSGFWDTPRTLE